ncbi:MAG: hypothetical protein RBS07_10830 [Lentimicrobium sp.]|nr:hypothetical protein [Lentimicrobium sp.]
MKPLTILPGCITIIIMLCILNLPSGAQVPEGFVPMDDSLKAMLHFYDADTILVILPDNYTIHQKDAHAIETFVFWKNKPTYTYKHESELNAADTLKRLQFFGPAFKFSPKTFSDIPFQISENGFAFNGQPFNHPNDALYYMHPSGKRIYTCRNGQEHPLVYIGFLAGAYQLYVFHGNEIIYSGNDALPSGESRLNDMDKLREDYFCHRINSRYFKLNFPCTFVLDSVSDSLGNELDDYVNQLCHHLNVDTTNIQRIETNFYTSREELQYFIAAPLWQTIYGKSFGDINHIMGFDLATFKHETGHSIIGAKIGFNPSPFFMEGFRQFTDYFFNEAAYDHDLKAFRNNPDLLTPTLVYANNAGFFRGMINYSISGVFTAYIIEKVGLEPFKTAYAHNSIDELLKLHGLSIEQWIEHFNRDY